MRVIDALNVNDAYCQGLELLLREGIKQQTRNGVAYSLATPLAVVYRNPRQRVLLDPYRDANPFFHLFESLWLLAGRNDSRWLDRFVRDFSSRFAEEDGRLHGSYGFRWRKHFDLEGGGSSNMPDQLDMVVELLTKNREDRRVVIQMWDPTADLGQPRKDVPCNLTVVPRVVHNRLDITVFNRSNDFVWGMTGANAVQFSVLQEYLAGRVGVAVGRYTQVSTNAHVYADHVEKLRGVMLSPTQDYPDTRSMGEDWSSWDRDLHTFFAWAEDFEQQPPTYPSNPWFEDTAQPLFAAHSAWREKDHARALSIVRDDVFDMAPDWRKAALAWMQRRLDKEKKNAG